METALQMAPRLPHYLVLMALAFAAVFVVIAGFVAALLTGEYPSDARDFPRCGLPLRPELQAYVGPLTDQYPPFGLTA